MNYETLQIRIGESAMRSFWHSMATNWSIMAARAQMEQVKVIRFDPLAPVQVLAQGVRVLYKRKCSFLSITS